MKLAYDLIWDCEVVAVAGEVVTVLGVRPDMDSAYIRFECGDKEYNVGIEAFKFLTGG